MLGRALTKVVPIVRAQTRQTSVVSGPPKVRMSIAEKIAHGVVMSVAWMAYPTWVLVNMKHYKKD